MNDLTAKGGAGATPWAAWAVELRPLPERWCTLCGARFFMSEDAPLSNLWVLCLACAEARGLISSSS